MIIMTKHGKDRIKVRLGLPKRAHMRHVKTVLCKGKLYSRTGYEQFKVMYQDFLYIFALSKNLEPILITTYKSKM